MTSLSRLHDAEKGDIDVSTPVKLVPATLLSASAVTSSSSLTSNLTKAPLAESTGGDFYASLSLTGIPPLPRDNSADSNADVKNEKSEIQELEVALPAISKEAPPKKRKEHVSRPVRFSLWLNSYRKFFMLVVTLNFVGLLLTALGKWQYPREYTGAVILGNLLFATLMRNELFGRILYLIVNTLFAKWTPLWFRLGCTSVLQHIGGIHSGCAVSSCAWLIFKVVLILIDVKSYHVAVPVTGLITNLSVLVAAFSAFPWIRNNHHNVFERFHRFAGWVALFATWIFVVLSNCYNLNTHSWQVTSAYLLNQQNFWFAFGLTVFTLAPWVTVRKVKVEVEIPSEKVAIIRFERGMQQGLLARIARSTVMEYHAFGIVSEGTHAKEHFLICGVQGDFTRSLVSDPPKYLWTRELKFAGVGNTSTLYRRGIRVCTGTGIGAALSTCMQNENWYLIWIGSNQERTFGPTITSLAYRNIPPERMTMWDSKKRGGRPDLMRLVRDAYHSFGAEVVFVTSNYQGNKEIMEGCKAERIPCFGTLWDF